MSDTPSTADGQAVTYPLGGEFPLPLGRTTDVSGQAWPQPNRAEPGQPNVVFVVLDDTGFGHLGCYGSPIETPHLDALAEGGLRFSNMHTTALCSPSRACILTGRNHHSNHMGGIPEMSTGFPGYDGSIPDENGFLSEILSGHGYQSFAVGKWHLTPMWEMSAAGPFDRWPLGRGFDRFYGFLGADANQYYPELVQDNHRVEPPKGPEDGYHLSEDIIDQAIRYIGDLKQAAPDKPFFGYVAMGAAHAPHHAPRDWIDQYAGQFDEGWEAYREQVFARQQELGIVPPDAELSRHDPDVPEWSSLSDDERRLYARMMEVFAGFLSHADHHIGRLVDFLRQLGELDNTLIMVISDNGASAEGGPTGSLNENAFINRVNEPFEHNLAAIDDLGGPKYFNHYPWGWTWAGNTPFRRWKRETYRGGVSDPFIVHYPARIAAGGEIRDQYTHAIDMVPTVLDLLGIDPPTTLRGAAQTDLEGTSFADSLTDADADEHRRTQYFEMLGHRAIYHQGWRAVCPWPGPSFSEAPFPFGAPIDAATLDQLDANGWELYHVAEDFAENHNVADEHPDKLAELIELWYREAERYQVLPVDGRFQMRVREQRPSVARPREQYVYYPGTSEVHPAAAPPILNRPHHVTAFATIDAEHTDGVLVSQGGVEGGFSFYVLDGKLCYSYNFVAIEQFHIDADAPIEPGRHALSFEFTPTSQPNPIEGRGVSARIDLFVDGRPVGSGDLPITMPIALGMSSGVNVGVDAGSPATPRYGGRFPFGGTIERIVYDVSGDHVVDHAEELRAALHRQ